jgi:membrane fusion protein, multidrug efflux system
MAITTSPASISRDGALPPASPVAALAADVKRRSWRRWALGLACLLLVAAVGVYVAPSVIRALSTVSTDDAYVNGHVTFVAARVPGQVTQVLVDNNMRVKKGDVLVRLDKEPYQVQVDIAKAAVVAAEADLNAAHAQVQGQVAKARANRFKLEHAMEDVNTQIASLRAAVATLASRKATLELAKQMLTRGEELAPKGSISQEEFDQRKQQFKVADAQVEQTLQQIYAIRVYLGLFALPAEGRPLTDVPENLDQNFSSVRQALGDLMQSAAEFGLFPATWSATPKETLDALYKQDPERNIDRIFAKLIPRAPAIKQAQAKLAKAERDLAQAELNLRYTDVFSEIDGVVTRRNVNPGNNVTAGQNLMAVRSLTEIWIDANFKETQLADLRIGQRVKIDVDMYGSQKEYEGRITGFTYGTGQTLSLLPPQNATGNFVKIVQRLPVKIELIGYDADVDPLFVGLSCTPYVYIGAPLVGDDPGKGKSLQPLVTERGKP